MKNSRNLAVPQSASSTAALLQRAIELHRQGDIRQAGLMYLDILEMERDNFGALQMLGVYALQTNDDQAAFDLISRALEIDPQQAMAHSNLGLALQRLQRFDDALLAYDQALQIDPDDLPAINNYGNMLSQLLRFSEAIVLFERALELSPAWSEALGSKGYALIGMARYEEALACIDRALEIDADLVTARRHREDALRGLKEAAQA